MIVTEIVAGCECDFYEVHADRWTGECDALGIQVESATLEDCRGLLNIAIGLASRDVRRGEAA
jgi:hypothetical protein